MQTSFSILKNCLIFVGIYLSSCITSASWIFRDKNVISGLGLEILDFDPGRSEKIWPTWLRIRWCTVLVQYGWHFFFVQTWVQYQLLHLHIRLSHSVISAQTRENKNIVQIFTFFHSYSYMSFTNAEQTVKNTFWEFTGSIYLHSHASKNQAGFPDHKVFSLKKITDQILSLTTRVFCTKYFTRIL